MNLTAFIAVEASRKANQSSQHAENDDEHQHRDHEFNQCESFLIVFHIMNQTLGKAQFELSHLLHLERSIVSSQSM